MKNKEDKQNKIENKRRAGIKDSIYSSFLLGLLILILSIGLNYSYLLNPLDPSNVLVAFLIGISLSLFYFHLVNLLSLSYSKPSELDMCERCGKLIKKDSKHKPFCLSCRDKLRRIKKNENDLKLANKYSNLLENKNK